MPSRVVQDLYTGQYGLWPRSWSKIDYRLQQSCSSQCSNDFLLCFDYTMSIVFHPFDLKFKTQKKYCCQQRTNINLLSYCTS